MVNRMVLNNVGYRPVRTALSVLAVAIEVILILSVVGLVHGLLEERAERQAGIGADIVIQSSGAGAIMGLSSGGIMSVNIANKVQEVPGVAAVTPVYMQSFGGLTLAWGIDLKSFNGVSGPFHVLAGHIFPETTPPLNEKDVCSAEPTPCQVVVDNIYAESQKTPVKVGDTINLWSNPFKVVGIVASGKGARLYAPIAVVQNLLGNPGRCTLFYVKTGSPNDIAPVIARLKDMLPNYPVTAMSEIYSLMVSGNLPGVKEFQTIMIAIAVIIGFLVIFMAMYTTVLERTREIGTLKAMGASKVYIVGLILRETVLISVIGYAAGVGAFFLMRHVVLKAFPSLTIQYTALWLGLASVIAIIGSILGAAYPATRAAKQDPIEALAYE